MHRTGRYWTLNAVFGILPLVATLLMARLSPASRPAAQWLSIARARPSAPCACAC